MVRQLHRGEFIDGAHNVVLLDGPGPDAKTTTPFSITSPTTAILAVPPGTLESPWRRGGLDESGGDLLIVGHGPTL